MADLFLDNDLTGTDLEMNQARTLAASPFSLDEMDAIFAWEVAPAFAFNLRSIAGEWAMWYTNEVLDRVLPILPLPRWRRRLKRFGNVANWKRLRRIVEGLRATS